MEMIDTDIIASFVKSSVLYDFSGKERHSEEYSDYSSKSDDRVIKEFCNDEGILDDETYLSERINSMEEDDVVLLVVGSRNLMLDLSRLFYIYCAKCLEDTYCLDNFTDAREIVNRKTLQINIYQQACKFVLIGNAESIMDFAKANYLSQFNGLKDYIKK